MIQGGSAGGLLMGAVLNLRPDLFKAVLAQVPFVDVHQHHARRLAAAHRGRVRGVGQSARREQYRWMRAYSPYDNLGRARYPAMLVRTALNDSQVIYWEPAKYVADCARSRPTRTRCCSRPIMAGGHGGASGRYDALRDTAFDYAFLLAQVGRAR